MTTVDDYTVEAVQYGESIRLDVYTKINRGCRPVNSTFVFPPIWIERIFGITFEKKVLVETIDILREQIKTDSEELKAERIVKNFPNIFDKAKQMIVG